MYRKYSDERIKATILQKLALYERLIYIYDKEAANAALNSTLLSVNTKGDVVKMTDLIMQYNMTDKLAAFK